MIYGVLDIMVAAAYIWLITAVIPNRSTGFAVLVWLLCGLMAAGGLGLILGTSWGRIVATVSSIVWLAACGLLILGLVTSAAYVQGIYDGVGQAAAAIGLLAAALSVELVGLLPALQLAHIRRTRKQVAP